ncbi:MAG: hypothetical protein ACRDA3_03255 [Peptostreptococcaceae bacterium]
MDFFINLGILGISLIVLGKLALKANKNTEQCTNFESLNKLICYMESELVAKTNLHYGKLLLITGILGALFYNTIGLLMILVMVLVVSLYLIKLLISGYKFYIDAR